MKRKLYIVLLIGVLAVFTGCSASSTPSSSNDTTSTQSNQNASLKPDRTMDLLGKVTVVNGSSLQVAELEMPEAPEGTQSPGDKDGQDGQPPTGDSQGTTPPERPSSDQQPPTGTESDSASAQDGSAPSQQPPAREMTYTETGKTYTLVISDDSLIVSRTTGSDGTTAEKVLSVSDLKEGDVLRVWVEKLDTSGGESTIIYAELETQMTN